MSTKNLLVIAPHPDDEIIGCAGTLLKLHEQESYNVYVIFITNGELEDMHDKVEIRLRESKKANIHAGFKILFTFDIYSRQIKMNRDYIIKEMVKVILKINPEFIFMPHKNEVDIDHKEVNAIVKEAYFIGRTSCPNSLFNAAKTKLLGYEIWTPISSFDVAHDITEYTNIKKALIRQYGSQNKDFDYVNFIISLNRYRGIMNGCRYSEVFTVEKWT